MHRRVLLYSSIFLLCFIFSAIHAQIDPDDDDDDSPDDDLVVITTSAPVTTTAPPASSPVATTPSTGYATNTTAGTTTKNYDTFGARYGYSNNYSGSDGGYYDDDYQPVGDGGIHPSSDGTDVGDFGPVYGRKSMLSQLDVWITAVDDWEQKGSAYKNKYKGNTYKGNTYKGNNYKGNTYKGNNYKGNNYKGNNYKDDDYKGSRSKRSYKKVSFPVKRYKNYRKFPTKRFPPLISIFPWVPIFYDKRTYQTIIFSPTGGLYIIPPLINFYGERFAVAQLIKWGYASLVSSGAPVGPGVDVAPLVQPPPPGGIVGPAFDPVKSQFVGGVPTKFSKFKPRYPQTIEEGGSYYPPPGKSNYGSSKPNYGSELVDYGGSRDQTLYPQGGPPKSGGY